MLKSANRKGEKAMENILTTFQTAKILNTSSENVRAMEKRGVLHATRVGAGSGMRLFSREEVEELARERSRAASSHAASK